MPLLDDCVNEQFEPGNIGASTGLTPVIVTPGSLYSPDDYPVDSVIYSLDFSKFYDSMYLGAL